MRWFYRLFWFGLYGGIIAISLPGFGKPESALALKNLGPDSSVDAVLEQTLDQPGASQRIREWLATLPPGRAILVVAPPNHMPAAITADLVSYLAWPRPVEISSEPERTRALLAQARQRYCAVGLCYLQPPSQGKISKSFGPALTFISTEHK